MLSGAALGVLGLGARTIFQAPIKALTEQSFIIRSFYWLYPQRAFKGTWKVIWHVESTRYPEENIDEVNIRRLFSNVSFITTANLKDGSTQQCVFVGKLAGQAVTGRWFNPQDQEHGYSGAFQFRLDGSLRAGKGTWLGWRNDGTVASDKMTLTKTS